MREIVWDTETTGFNPEEGHKLIEIGAVEIINGLPTGKSYHQFINPEREIPEEATRVHGITDDRVAEEPIFKYIADDFLEFIGDAPLVAHNANFDMSFINYELMAIGYPALTNEVIDTLAIAKKKFPGQQANLDALCRRFNIDLSARTYHGALLDSELLAEVYLELNGGLQQGLSFDAGTSVAGSSDQSKNSIEYKKTVARPARRFSAHADELKNHEEYLEKNIRGAIWKN